MKLGLRTRLGKLLGKGARSGRNTADADDDAGCPICDHPFPELNHMCVGGPQEERAERRTPSSEGSDTGTNGFTSPTRYQPSLIAEAARLRPIATAAGM